MSRFIAIPVNQGDAFYLDREEGFSILVDGGRSRRAFPSMFWKATKECSVNVVICTHNDADHAEGILGFLEAGLRCEEVWLPGRWLSVLPDVLRPFVEVFDELENDIEEIYGSSDMKELQLSPSPIEAYAERVRDPGGEVSASEEGPTVPEGGWPESYVQMLERAEPWEAPPYWPFFPRHYGLYQWLGPASGELLWSALDAAGRIRNIAIEAFHKGIPVRWFDFDTAKPSGGLPELQPVNARAVARVRPRVVSLLAHLALTTLNKQSLVFWSPPTAHHPGALFTADSDLVGVSLPSQLDHAIVTAPHHGSEANAKAYTIVAGAAQNAFQSIIWVRSDGRYKARPGNTYLKVASNRFCTLCRRAEGSSTAKRAVCLYPRNGVWVTYRASRACSCQ